MSTFPVRLRHHNTAKHREELARAINMADYGFAAAQGDITGTSAVNKFGRTTNADNGIATDVWDRANATQDQDIWVAPTAARVHSIVSTSAQDASGGTGALSVTIYGLTSWTASEVSETKTLTGATPVNTDNSYVIIHRMVCNLQSTSTSANAGLITATAASDSTVTAQINAGEGQTQMAIYGISSLETAYLKRYYASAIKAAASTSANISLLVNPSPNTAEIPFLVKHTIGVSEDGTNTAQMNFDPTFKIAGPAIIKIQVNASANNTDVSAGFDLYVVEN